MRKQGAITSASPIIIAKKLSFFIFATPTSMLSFGAVMSLFHHSNTGIESLAQLSDYIKHSNGGILLLAFSVFLGSQAVLFYLNSLYLMGSLETVANLFTSLFKTVYKFCKKPSKQRFLKLPFLKSSLFLAALGTSLIFAEVGAKALSFLGLPGIIVGFLLSFIVYFSTRFASTCFYLEGLSKNKHKNQLMSQLQQIDPKIFDEQNSTNASGHIEGNIQSSSFIVRTKKSSIRRLLYYIATVLGILLATGLSIATLLTFIPIAIEGFNRLFQTSIGVSASYKDPMSFILGGALTLLTLFFYGKSISELPTQLLTTILDVKHGKGHYFFTVVTTLLAVFTSSSTAAGFFLLPRILSHVGALSYLNELEPTIPYLMASSVACMLWSHLQSLINTKNTAYFFKTNPHSAFFKAKCNLSGISNDEELPVSKSPLIDVSTDTSRYDGSQQEEQYPTPTT